MTDRIAIKKNSRITTTFFYTVFGTLLSFLGSMVILWGSRWFRLSSMNIPISSNGDALFTTAYIKRLSEGWYWNTPRLGYPFGSKDGDFPILDLASSVILKIIVAITNSPVATMNLYFIAGFPIVYVATFYVARRYGLSALFSFLAGLTYTFLPFHFQRFNHLFYTWYFIAPLFFLVALILYENRIFSKGEFYLEKIGFLLFVLIISMFGVYFAVFGAILILATMCIQFSVKDSKRSLLFGAYSLIAVALGLLICALPSMVFDSEFGKNSNVVSRSSAESEIYGFKLMQLLLPRTEHRVDLLSTINATYSKSSPLVNENMMASLGAIGSIGFLVIVFSLLFYSKSPNKNLTLNILSPITVVLFLFGTIGGLGSLFSILLTPNIRAWNRISIFIAFSSILGFFLLSQLCFDRYRSQFMKIMKPVFVVLIILGGFLDQVNGVCIACNVQEAQKFKSDSEFFSRLEESLPINAPIYQLPFMSYPEIPNLNKLDGYGHLDAYIHTSRLRWSYGMVKGRASTDFYRVLSTMRIVEQLPILKRLGFQAIYVDRDGYQDNGNAITNELSTILGQPFIQNGDGNRLVFRLLNAATTALEIMTDKQIFEKSGLSIVNGEIRYFSKFEDGIDFSREGLPSFVQSVSGLSGVEEWGRWSDANLGSSIDVTFSQPLPNSFSLELKGSAFGPNIGSDLTIICGNVSRKVKITGSDFFINEIFDLSNELVTVVRFVPSNPVSPQDLGISADTRKLSIGFKSLKILEN